MDQELPDVQAGFQKGKGTRDQIANIHWIMEKVRELQKNILFSPWGLQVGQDIATEQQQPIENFSLRHQQITLPVIGE